jgi:hypothetical protein
MKQIWGGGLRYRKYFGDGGSAAPDRSKNTGIGDVEVTILILLTSELVRSEL